MPDSKQPDADGADAEKITEVRAVEFGETKPEEDGKSLPLDILMDIGLPVRVEMGRTRMTVRELLELQKGSVIQLDKTAGEPVNLYVRDKCFARGEVVVAGNNFGLRITSITEHGRRAVRRQQEEADRSADTGHEEGEEE